jgi:SPASM domain peptide maturase of grasp-with-spasm system
MARDWHECSNLFIQSFADCIPVQGATNSAIYDLTRGEIVTFPATYYKVLLELQGMRVRDLLDKYEANANRDEVLGFLDFLDEHELIMLVDNALSFPRLSTKWEYPGKIQNAIIDISHRLHDFAEIFAQLSALGCQHVQIRSYSDLLSVDACRRLLEDAKHKALAGVELILKYDHAVSEHVYAQFVREQPLMTGLIIHSSPTASIIAVDEIDPEFSGSYSSREIRFVCQKINAETHCGLITPEYLTLPSVGTFFEAVSYNGCLNRKIAIDVDGNIKNCPSMARVYGNVSDMPLSHALGALGFKDPWHITKDSVRICRDCEYRYACSDCRAYLQNPGDLYSKPLKCGYDPYTGQWEDWTEAKSNGAIATSYGIELPSITRKVFSTNG